MLAFFPKVTALVIAIPGPVAAAYIVVLLGLLFVQGMKIVIQDGVDHRKATVVGLAFWFGTAFQNKWVFPDLLGDGFLGVLLGNGMTSGAIVAIVLVAFIELTSTRRRRMAAALDVEALPALEEFLRALASKAGWDAASTERLVLVGEETLSSMLSGGGDGPPEDEPRRLVVTARTEGGGAELEFLSATEGENIEDRLAYMGETPEIETAGRYRSACCATTRRRFTTRNTTAWTSSRCT